jgi:hypothetical protein
VEEAELHEHAVHPAAGEDDRYVAPHAINCAPFRGRCG